MRTEMGASEDALHEHEVEPAVELATDLGHAGDDLETDALVEHDRLDVRGVDRGHHHVDVGGAGVLDERLEQHASETAAPVVLVDVDGVLDGVAVAGPAPVTPE